MGLYIEDNADGSGKTKRGLLDQYGESRIIDSFTEYKDQENRYLVCLVENGLFNAAGVCYSKKEFERFNNIYDLRPKFWYYLHEDDINKLTNNEFKKYLIE